MLAHKGFLCMERRRINAREFRGLIEPSQSADEKVTLKGKASQPPFMLRSFYSTIDNFLGGRKT